VPSKLPDLFVGPLGKAQLDAIKFVAGMQHSRTMLEIIEKIDTVEELLKSESLSDIERSLAQKVKKDLEESYMDLVMVMDEDKNGKQTENQVF
jgi:hypothetical protein